MVNKASVLELYDGLGITEQLLAKHRVVYEADLKIIVLLYQRLGENASALLEQCQPITHLSLLKRCLEAHPLLQLNNIEDAARLRIVLAEINLIHTKPAYRSWVANKKAGYDSLDLSEIRSMLSTLCEKRGEQPPADVFMVELFSQLSSGWHLTYLKILLESYQAQEAVPDTAFEQLCACVKALTAMFRTAPANISNMLRSGVLRIGWHFLGIIQQGRAGLIMNSVELAEMYGQAHALLYPKETLCVDKVDTFVKTFMASPGLTEDALRDRHYWVRTVTSVALLCKTMLGRSVEKTMLELSSLTTQQLYISRKMLTYIAQQWGIVDVSTKGVDPASIYDFLLRFNQHVFAQRNDCFQRWDELLKSSVWYRCDPKLVIEQCLNRAGVFQDILPIDEGLGASVTSSPLASSPGCV